MRASNGEEMKADPLRREGGIRKGKITQRGVFFSRFSPLSPQKRKQVAAATVYFASARPVAQSGQPAAASLPTLLRQSYLQGERRIQAQLSAATGPMH
jgi:hypothetical protein